MEDARCAPWVGFGRRVEIKSHFRSAISPWIDRRQKLDIIRDKLEERGSSLLRQSELTCDWSCRPIDGITQALDYEGWTDCDEISRSAATGA
jgi:hypothetical protein